MKTYRAYSLVEMLITIFIFGIVMLITTQTLTTLIRVSAVTKSKTITRTEADYIIELVDRLFTNSNIADVYIYESSEYREYSEDEGLITVGDVNNPPYHSSLGEGVSGNEIHFRPYGYSVWVCLGYFENEDNSRGYFLKRTLDDEDLDVHEDCFNPGDLDNPPIILHADDIDVNNFSVMYIRSSILNNIFYVDLELEPIYWIPGDRQTIERSVFRNAVITTRGLTWY